MLASPRYKHLFSPGSIGTMRLKNRIVMAPMVTQFTPESGEVSPVLRDYLAQRAKGGVGLIETEATCVDPAGKGWVNGLGLDRDGLVRSHVELTEAVHRCGAKIAVQLHHGGNRADLRATGGRLVGASPVGDGDVMPEELTPEEIIAVARRFGEAAERAKRAGYDAVEIHGAHGYLLHQFLSPATNHRTDEYGGSPENRLRFSLEVVHSVRKAVGPDFPVIYRLSSEGGYGIEDTVAFAKAWEAAGVNALHVSIGGTAPATLLPPETSPMAVPQGYLTEYAQAVKNAVSIPVIAVGEIREPAFAEEVLEQGKADFIALARPLLADPDWGVKASQGRDEDILMCISCDHCRGCIGRRVPVRCLVNPRLGREGWLDDPQPTEAPRRVMVVGSGPAGMEVARVAALRGHTVSLYEAEAITGGGQLAMAQVPPFKEKIGWLREYMTRQLASLPVDVHLGSRVTAASVEKESPDVLVVATGAVPLIPDIPGIHGENVVTAHELLMSEAVPQGKRVVVLGGRQVGCETAEYMAMHGNTVTVLARSPASQLAEDAPPTYRAALLRRLTKASVEIVAEHDVTDIRSDELTARGPEDTVRLLPVDLVVIARGAVPQRSLPDEVAYLVAEVHVIGDSQEPRTIAEATYEGTLLGRQI